jgi:hypothetical protein
MRKHRKVNAVLTGVGLVLLLRGTAWCSNKEETSLFKYAGGTEKLHEGCPGQLHLTDNSMIFDCPEGSITAMYDAIRLMQYRPDVSRQVRKIRVKWKLRPRESGGKHNRYFTVVFSASGQTHIMVLEVDPDEMRPYLAEIDLKSGKRVEVWELEVYDE